MIEQRRAERERLSPACPICPPHLDRRPVERRIGGPERAAGAVASQEGRDELRVGGRVARDRRGVGAGPRGGVIERRENVDPLRRRVLHVVVVVREVEHPRLRLDRCPVELLAHPLRPGLGGDLLHARLCARVAPAIDVRVEADDQAAQDRRAGAAAGLARQLVRHHTRDPRRGVDRAACSDAVCLAVAGGGQLAACGAAAVWRGFGGRRLGAKQEDGEDGKCGAETDEGARGHALFVGRSSGERPGEDGYLDA